ncbi:hypothetical protein FUA48_12820 [Flavobacterium alkalisoli]|uniref:SRPBCC family protein n=1 Tax=Flavobacterium alkalisoli TaxID=2602769 RepID=A0A5B9FU79_9FLAO|nr:hypothetical protein [Flavobacterium alkalisoli]QEE50424.1 hypothetical protein FUA48_12820 [Flavobacterium alkalisoli]
MKQFYRQKTIMLAIGIILGIVYGLTARFIFESSIATVSFLVLIPVGLGVIPMLFSYQDQLNSYKWLLFIPWLSILAILGVLLLLRVEDIMCAVILAIPFFCVVTFVAFLFIFINATIANRKNKRNNRNKALGLILLPFLFYPLEQSIESPSNNYIIESEVIINAPANKIWNNIVAVDTIQDYEYNPGVLNRLGIPRPINARVTKYGLGGIRTGHFEDGLLFTETITKYDLNKEIAFSINVNTASCENKIFQKHVLQGDYFRFENAVYRLTPMPDGKIKLSLASEYNLTSNVNFYGKFWADIMIEDFQDRLLQVIANRCEE